MILSVLTYQNFVIVVVPFLIGFLLVPKYGPRLGIPLGALVAVLAVFGLVPGHAATGELTAYELGYISGRFIKLSVIWAPSLIIGMTIGWAVWRKRQQTAGD
jgi:hypothetical protein